jgi:hypothetical protein
MNAQFESKLITRSSECFNHSFFITLEVHKLSQRRTKVEENSAKFDLEETSFAITPAKVEIGSGYSVAVGYDENNEPIVNVKTYGTVDMVKVQRELEDLFPSARIRHLNPASSVAVFKKGKKKRK